MGGLLHLVQRGGAWAGYGPAQSPVVIVTSAKAEVMRSGRFDCHSVCLCVSAQSQGYFILEVIRIDLHCHLEVTVTQQGHFDIKSTVAAQKR